VFFNTAVIAQEFYLLLSARARSGADKGTAFLWYAGILPGFVYTMLTLPAPGRRRYGGYICHLGIVFMIMGFTGHSWNQDAETTLSPGQRFEIDRMTIEYVGPRMEVDNAKRMIFADIRVSERGKKDAATGADRLMGQLAPAKFIYKKMPESPTTEVAMMHTLRDDLYLVVGAINPQTKTASIQIHVNSLVWLIWFGCVVLVLGSFLCMWPDFSPGETRAWRVARGTAQIASSVMMGIVLALLPVPAWAQAGGSSSLHAGTVKIENPAEKEVFAALRCMCGTCARDLLSTCACATAEDTRARLRTKIGKGMTRDQIVAEYAAEYGSESMAIPPDTGVFRSLYVVPIVGAVGGVVGLAVLVRRWRAKDPPPGRKPEQAGARDAYDDRLDQELRDLDE
jgi:cytochrome c-type biogenesis protein CcmF